MTTSPLPRLARVAAWVALVMGALTLLSFTTNAILMASSGLVLVAGGIQIFQRYVWGAYGMALYGLTQFYVLAVVFLRSTNRSVEGPWLVPVVLFNVVWVVLFFLAGQELSTANNRKGLAAPWIAFALAWILFFSFFQPFVIPTAAMEPTLLQGDRIVVRRLPNPSFAQGDLAVYLNPLDHRQTYVKRIVGIPGDRIRITNKILIRNGKPVKEPYAIHETNYLDAYRDNFPTEPNVPLPPSAQQMLAEHVVNGEVIVPPGMYFIMGDNRDKSYDSRYTGLVSSTELIGKPVLIYDSRNQSGIQWDRFFRLL